MTEGISTVIPLYNKEKFVERTLRSVMNQTRPPDEIVLVNDGSTDRSVEVVLAMKIPRLRLIHQDNAGPAAARNLGFQEARHAHIAFLDADDEWHPDYLATVHATFHAASQQRSIGIVTTLLHRESEVHDSPMPRTGPDWHWVESFCDACTGSYPVSSSSAFIHRDVLIEMKGFDTRVRLKEDVDLWIRIGLRYAIVRVNRVLATIHNDDPTRATRVPRPREIPIDVESLCRHFGCRVDDIPLLPERRYAQHTLYRFCLGMLKYRRFDLFDRYVALSSFTLKRRLFMQFLRRTLPLLPGRPS